MATPESTPPLRILLADDHQIVRDGVRRLIETQAGWSVVGEASDGREAVALAAKLRPDIAVLDLWMPELNGLEATRQIRRDSPMTEVLIFSGAQTEEMVLSVYEAGARSCLLKTEPKDRLLEALRTLSLHKPYFTPEVAEIVFARFLSGGKSAPVEATPDRGRLTAREREIVQLLAEGKSNKEVANTLKISVKTAEAHRAAIMRKLGFETFSDLVRYAIRNQIIQP